MERVTTGIPGFDELAGNGIPKGSSVLLSGGSGTGKTIFAMQYLYEGAAKYSEPGLFVTLEGSLKNIAWNMESFGWDIKKFQDKNLLRIYRLNLDSVKYQANIEDQIDKELAIISSLVKDIGAERLVIDSTTAFGVFVRDEGLLRGLLYKFTTALKDLNCTSLLTAETGGGKTDYSAFHVEEFISDGIVALYFTPPHRSLFIRKMRGTDHSKSIHPFSITAKKGIAVSPKEQVLWEAIK